MRPADGGVHVGVAVVDLGPLHLGLGRLDLGRRLGRLGLGLDHLHLADRAVLIGVFLAHQGGLGQLVLGLGHGQVGQGDVHLGLVGLGLDDEQSSWPFSTRLPTSKLMLRSWPSTRAMISTEKTAWVLPVNTSWSVTVLTTGLSHGDHGRRGLPPNFLLVPVAGRGRRRHKTAAAKTNMRVCSRKHLSHLPGALPRAAAWPYGLIGRRHLAALPGSLWPTASHFAVGIPSPSQGLVDDHQIDGHLTPEAAKLIVVG